MSSLHKLDLYIDPSYQNAESLHSTYMNHVTKHNLKLLENKSYADSGFDLLVPEETHPEYDPENLQEIPFLKINHQIIAAMSKPTSMTPTGFYIYPRSSIATKKCLRLANSVGIIDAGYRGHLIAAFDVIPDNQYNTPDNNVDSRRKATQYERLVQICAPDLSPIHVTLHPLGHTIKSNGTTRGDGGFGSTGK